MRTTHDISLVWNMSAAQQVSELMSQEPPRLVLAAWGEAGAPEDGRRGLVGVPGQQRLAGAPIGRIRGHPDDLLAASGGRVPLRLGEGGCVGPGGVQDEDGTVAIQEGRALDPAS